MCQGFMSQMVSAQMNGRKFEIVKGVRYESREEATLTARSVGECALMCVMQKSCSNFNFGSGQCELVSGTAFCSADAPGWTNGYYLTGKCQRKVTQLKYGLAKYRVPCILRPSLQTEKNIV